MSPDVGTVQPSVCACLNMEKTILESWSSDETISPQLAERARITLKFLEGSSSKSIALDLNIREYKVRYWLQRFEAEGISGLKDRGHRRGSRYTSQEFREKVLETLLSKPPSGSEVWNGQSLARHLNTSVHAVCNVLRKAGIPLGGASPGDMCR
jgi:transposase